MSLLQEIEQYGLADCKQNKKYKVKRKPPYFKNKVSDTFTFYNQGKASHFKRNTQGRCIDAPCCGCCTI
jgi:hypothetical protein